jgi:hypothetical protein
MYSIGNWLSYRRRERKARVSISDGSTPRSRLQGDTVNGEWFFLLFGNQREPVVVAASVLGAGLSVLWTFRVCLSSASDLW